MNNEEFNILNNIADILSSDPVLGATLLVSQNIDLDLFVYHLVDNYNEFKVEPHFKYTVGSSKRNYYVFNIGIIDKPGLYVYRYPDVQDISEYVKIELINLINTL